jgi:heterodisulfide reductase subunit B
MPTLHMSQLIGLAAGLESSELKFQRHVTPVGEKIKNAVVTT